jgi:TetR/AcrR family acrAB operon transcriptional repressor
MGATKEQAEKTREHLLNSALNLFNEKGFSATRLEDIAKVAGVTRGAIYWHFKNKMDIFSALFEQTIEFLFKDFMKIVTSELTSIEKLRESVIQFSKKLLTDEISRSFAFIFYGIEWTKEVQEIAHSTMEHMKWHENHPLLAVVQEGQKKGQIKDDVSPETIIKAMKIIYRGLVDLIISKNEKIDLDDIVPIVDCFFFGIKK